MYSQAIAGSKQLINNSRQYQLSFGEWFPNRIHGSFEKMSVYIKGHIILEYFSSNFQKHPYGHQLAKNDAIFFLSTTFSPVSIEPLLKYSDDENVMNLTPVSPSSEMRNVMKRMLMYLDAHSYGEQVNYGAK
ncbi:hypothetical protein TNCV_3666771 [Trichonephila clavipes]|nr:hypothetical protein TNCV_3666771 [Trichonephila clavipes]